MVSNHTDNILESHQTKTILIRRELLYKTKENIEGIKFKVSIGNFHKEEKEIPNTIEYKEVKITNEFGTCLTEIQGDNFSYMFTR